MTPVVISGVFAIAWFVTLFCLLPVGLGGPLDPDTGAPLNPRLGFKFLIATGTATVVTLIFYGLRLMGWIDI